MKSKHREGRRDATFSMFVVQVMSVQRDRVAAWFCFSLTAAAPAISKRDGDTTLAKHPPHEARSHWRREATGGTKPLETRSHLNAPTCKYYVPRRNSPEMSDRARNSTQLPRSSRPPHRRTINYNNGRSVRFRSDLSSRPCVCPTSSSFSTRPR